MSRHDLLRHDRAIYESFWGLYWLGQEGDHARLCRKLRRRIKLHKTMVLTTGRIFKRRDPVAARP